MQEAEVLENDLEENEAPESEEDAMGFTRSPIFKKIDEALRARGRDPEALLTAPRDRRNRFIDAADRDAILSAARALHLEDGFTINSLCSFFSIGNSVLTKQVFGLPTQRGYDTNSEKRALVRQIEEGAIREDLSAYSYCKKTGTSYSSYVRWVSQFEEDGSLPLDRPLPTHARPAYRAGTRSRRDDDVELHTYDLGPRTLPVAVEAPAPEAPARKGKFVVIIGDDGSFDKVMGSVRDIFG